MPSHNQPDLGRRTSLPRYRNRVLKPLVPVVVVGLAMATIVFGLLGFRDQYYPSVGATKPDHQHDSLIVLKTAQLFLLNSGADDDDKHPRNDHLVVACWTAVLFFAAVSALVAFSVLGNSLWAIRRLCLRDHTLLCGLGRVGLELLDDLRRKGRGMVVIERDEKNPWVEYARRRGARIVVGDATSADTLLQARAERAREAFVATGDDGVNLEVAAELEHVAEEWRGSGVVGRVWRRLWADVAAFFGPLDESGTATEPHPSAESRRKPWIIRARCAVARLGRRVERSLTALKRRVRETGEAFARPTNRFAPSADVRRRYWVCRMWGRTRAATASFKQRVQAAFDAICMQVEPPKLRIHLHVLDMDLATTFRARANTAVGEKSRTEAFNVARAVAAKFVGERLWDHAPKAEGEVAHYVVLGFGAMGQAVAVQLAQLAHFPNHKRSRITIVEANAPALARAFLARYPRFCPWSDHRVGVPSFSFRTDEWTDRTHGIPAPLDDADPAVRYACNARFLDLAPNLVGERFVHELVRDFTAGVKPVVVVCASHDRENYEIAARLRDRLALERPGRVPIFVWLPKQPALARTLAAEGLEAFGECRDVATHRAITAPLRETLGRHIHIDYHLGEALDRHRKAGGTVTTEVMVELVAAADRAWATMAEPERERNNQPGDHAWIKLAALGLTVESVPLAEDRTTQPMPTVTDDVLGTLAIMEHHRWIGERLMGGWRFSPDPGGDRRQADKDRKRNYNLVPWDRCAEVERKKDVDQVRKLLSLCRSGHIVVKPRVATTPPAEPAS